MTREEWSHSVLRAKAFDKRIGKRQGTTMFPTQHDITPANYEHCVRYLRMLLEPGNDVLIVSKPHLECIEGLCRELEQYKQQILFRFTIGAYDDTVLRYWEPGAPCFGERLASLQHAHWDGFQTSVSMEPVLDWRRVLDTFHLLIPNVTQSIWIGTMNYIDQRVAVETEEDARMIADMKEWQTQETFEAVYEALKDHPLVRWKESMKEALGLEIPTEVGLDI
jgi:DNA repair photolyase